ncbi:sigma-70 family RNA polymerase sigma factor [Virgibacillus doumboii]|uniref:sigma-70 family RNA polymerase sigma factor n=1 Tax=Virgibacillus doumboii TaxID=2697503 RepID=UPI001FEA38AF|nr:sigma-70 family RNA polymerase sigma factor [Virgibacillus doumboii]
MSEDKELVQQAIKGSNEAFLELMQIYKIDLYKTALSYLRNQNEALEAVQEVTFRAYRKIHTVRNASFFKTWLIRIMINYCNDQLRKKKHLVFDDETIQRRGVSDNLENIELEDAIMGLDDRSREVLTLKYFHDLKIKDIAVAMKCPEGTVKTWLNKALKALRDMLDDKEGNHHV